VKPEAGILGLLDRLEFAEVLQIWRMGGYNQFPLRANRQHRGECARDGCTEAQLPIAATVRPLAVINSKSYRQGVEGD
jgi:hypothetical protein